MNRRILSSESGVALVLAILACLILFAVGTLIISLSVGDLRSTVKVYADKKALAATETGIHMVVKYFDPSNMNLVVANNAAADPNDASQLYSVILPWKLNALPVTLPGYSASASDGSGLVQYATRVTGQNTTYNSRFEVNLGFGYGPVQLGTGQP